MGGGGQLMKGNTARSSKQLKICPSKTRVKPGFARVGVFPYIDRLRFAQLYFGCGRWFSELMRKPRGNPLSIRPPQLSQVWAGGGPVTGRGSEGAWRGAQGMWMRRRELGCGGSLGGGAGLREVLKISEFGPKYSENRKTPEKNIHQEMERDPPTAGSADQ